ncbi:MAG: fatty acid--CoA ligase, partial [Actinobacteria bacterium]|nr:fatty acid--CoA ligase [Actinomycetota bacterium]
MGNTITSLGSIVRTHSQNIGNKTALVLGDRTQSWSQLYERSMKMANALAAAGVGSQDRIAFLDK